MNEKLLAVKNEDFEKHKEEIRDLLSRELVIRYHHQLGQLEHSLNKDPYIEEALVLLSDNDKYNSILKGTYKQQE